jgi:hypothetical protein
LPRQQKSWTDEGLGTAVAASTSWRQVMAALGLAYGGNAYNKVKRRAVELSLDTSHFQGQGWNLGTGSGRDIQAQRASKKRWYDAHRDVYYARNVRNRAKRVALVRELKDKPCADCGQRYPFFAMEFDHRDGETKEFNIATAVRTLIGLNRLLREIEKCDLVCCLCHRFRTARRAGWSQGQTAGDVDFLSDLAEDL